MEWNLKEGTKNLYQLEKEELQGLIDTLSIKKIANIFNISQSSARRIVSERMDHYKITIARTRSVSFRPSQEPFSEDEMDYGRHQRINKQIITKDGLLVFEGNAPILKKKNQLTEVVKTYVGVMLRNNQPVNFIKT